MMSKAKSPDRASMDQGYTASMAASHSHKLQGYFSIKIPNGTQTEPKDKQTSAQALSKPLLAGALARSEFALWFRVTLWQGYCCSFVTIDSLE
jgi:hypothetical protein